MRALLLILIASVAMACGNRTQKTELVNIYDPEVYADVEIPNPEPDPGPWDR